MRSFKKKNLWILVLLILITLKDPCLAEAKPDTSIHFQQMTGLSENQKVSIPPVMVGNKLYLSTATDAGEQKFQLWRDPNAALDDPNTAWDEVGLTNLTDPNITALGSYRDDLYVATTKGNLPYLWRLQDPNQEKWKSVGPSELKSGEIKAISYFDDHLYLGVVSQNGSENSVQFWRSKKSDAEPDDWEKLDRTYTGMISSAFQKFDNKLYLGLENAQHEGEVWIWETGKSKNYSQTPSKGFGTDQILALAASDDILYALSQRGSNTHLWSMASWGDNFNKSSLSWDSTTALSLQSLGPYLFMGLGNDEGGEIWRSYYDPNLEEKQWGKISAYDREDNSLLSDPNRLCWLYADETNGYLYLEEDTSEGVRVWKSEQLPIITIITSDKTYSSKAVFPSVGAFNSTPVQVRWKSTKTGNYTVRLLRFTDPNDRNDRIEDPNIPIQTQAGKEATTPLSVTEEGTYTGQIADDPNQDYPVMFSFIYDTTPPEVPTGVLPLVRNEKLTIEWSASKDKLSRVAKYTVWWKDVTQDDANEPEVDANTVDFTGAHKNEPEAGETSIHISPLINGRRYAVAVSAIDTAGNESARSRAVFGTPELGQGVLDLTEEDGGCFLYTLKKQR